VLLGAHWTTVGEDSSNFFWQFFYDTRLTNEFLCPGQGQCQGSPWEELQERARGACSKCYELVVHFYCLLY